MTLLLSSSPLLSEASCFSSQLAHFHPHVYHLVSAPSGCTPQPTFSYCPVALLPSQTSNPYLPSLSSSSPMCSSTCSSMASTLTSPLEFLFLYSSVASLLLNLKDPCYFSSHLPFQLFSIVYQSLLRQLTTSSFLASTIPPFFCFLLPSLAPTSLSRFLPGTFLLQLQNTAVPVLALSLSVHFFPW